MDHTQTAFFRQVPPEQQICPWDTYEPEAEWPGVYITGNTQYNGLRGDELQGILETMGDYHSEYLAWEMGEMNDEDKPEPPDAPCGVHVIEMWAHYSAYNGSAHGDRIAHALGTWHGRPYEMRILRGTCQSEWNTCYYPAQGCPEAPTIHKELTRLEGDYFNTCTEFCLLDNPDGEPETYGFYTYNGYDIPSYAAELREYGEGEPVISLFEGYTHIPKYTHFTAVENQAA